MQVGKVGMRWKWRSDTRSRCLVESISLLQQSFSQKNIYRKTLTESISVTNHNCDQLQAALNTQKITTKTELEGVSEVAMEMQMGINSDET